MASPDAAAGTAWAPVQRIRTYEQVMGQIEEQILSGALKAGDRLPSEREFAAILGVSRPSLRDSLRVLEALGLVAIRPGPGSDGGAVLVGELAATPGYMNLLKLQLALGQFSQLDVLQTRVALESWSVAEAARRATEDDHRALAAILDRMDDPSIVAADFNELDTAFHVRIAETAGNTLVAHLMRSLRIAIHRQMVEAYARLENWRVTATTVRSEHRALLKAIESGDAELAAHLIHTHITDFYDIGSAKGEPAVSG